MTPTSTFVRTALERYDRLKERSQRLKAIEEAARNGDIDKVMQLALQSDQSPAQGDQPQS